MFFNQLNSSPYSDCPYPLNNRGKTFGVFLLRVRKLTFITVYQSENREGLKILPAIIELIHFKADIVFFIR